MNTNDTIDTGDSYTIDYMPEKSIYQDDTMSCCVYSNPAEVEAVQARLRAEHIPCDVIHLDPSWMKTFYYHRLGVDACDFAWNHEAWPDHQQMLHRWLVDGFNTCFWVNPYIPEGTALYEEAQAQNYLLKTADGAVARLEHGTIDDQYMLGPDLLVAPVLMPGATSRYVYFPKGRWWALEDVACVVDGPGFVEVAAPLERIPLFVRAGAVIPRYIHEPQHLKGPAPEEMELFIYPGPSQKSLWIAENGFDIQIDYTVTAEKHTLTINPVPISFTIWLMDRRATKVESTRDALLTWEVLDRDTMISVDAADGVNVGYQSLPD